MSSGPDRFVALLSAFAVGVGALVSSALAAGAGEVRVWEEKITIPTYFTNPPEECPIFFSHDSYQGASRVVYPYPMQDNLSMRKGEQEYTGLFLENEYIKLCVLPEIGGRLFYATDKTNGYELFYRQHVIKPMLIGMLGAWISGGIEFCVFHHHRASTHMPVEYQLEENADGSKTIWIGEFEPRHRMRWNIGISLHPGRSWVRVNGTLVNATEHTNSFLYWANVAVHVNNDYQILFPEGTQYAVFHAKNSFAHWPITREVYNGKEYYKNGIDASWYKNHPTSGSFFAHDIKVGNLAGYDWGKQAGTMHVANHHIVKGAKLWQWGTKSTFDRKALTDNDGPYAELMTGAYSDNQPDYSWIKPYEVKQFEQTWYPLRETEGMRFGNLDATVNLRIDDGGRVFIAANTTKRFDNASVVLLHKDKQVFRRTIDIDPATPFHETVAVGGEPREQDLVIKLVDNKGGEVISYRPKVIPYNPDLPPVVEPPGPPESFMSNEELFYAGQRIYQFHNARVDPADYFEEALKRDPYDVRCNTAMGIIRQKQGDYEAAKEHFNKAIARITANYTRPRNCEPLYHLGVIQKREGAYSEAMENLYRAVWDYEFRSAAYFQIAAIHTIRGDYPAALEAVDESLAVNGLNVNALSLKTSLLRLLHRRDEAVDVARKILSLDHLNYYANHELALLLEGREARSHRDRLTALLRDYPENYLELASYYLGTGLLKEARGVLEMAVESRSETVRGYPTVHYYLGYINHLLGEERAARKEFATASNRPIKYCFPFRLESVPVFETALQYNSDDARACYYLGNLYYDKQPLLALTWWEKAVARDPDMAMAHRNLGWGYQQAQQKTDRAVASYQTAIEKDPEQPRYYLELDKLMELRGDPVQARLALLTKSHRHLEKLQQALMREILVLVLAGEYDRAIDLMGSRVFYRQEGVDIIHELHADAHLLKGRRLLAAGDFDAGVKELLLADTYPENQMIERSDDFRANARVFYYIGEGYERAGDRAAAEKYYRMAAAQDKAENEFLYYKGAALARLGKQAEADALFARMIEMGESQLASKGEVNFFAKFGEDLTARQREAISHHIVALGYLGKGDRERAKQSLANSLAADPNHLWSRVYNEEL